MMIVLLVVVILILYIIMQLKSNGNKSEMRDER